MNHFSIITVVRNDVAGLKRTRESLKGQSYKKWTHIVVDGGSNDSTVRYLKSLSTKNTIYISEKDNGIYDAMNKGWRLATPESFIFYLNARDLFAHRDSLKIANEALNAAPGSNWGCTTHEERFEDGSGWSCKLVSEPSVRNQLYAFGYRSHQGIVIRQSYLESLGGFDESYRIAADWDLFVKAILIEKPMEWVFPLAIFELGGMSSQKILDAHHELISLRKKYKIIKGKNRLYEEIWRMFYLQYMGYTNPIMRTHSKLIRIRSSLKFLLQQTNSKLRFRGGAVSLLGFRIAIQRTRPTRVKRKKIMKQSTRPNIRNLAIEKGFLIYLNNKLQLEPYRSPHE